MTLDTGFTLDLTNSGTSVFEIASQLFTAGTFDLVSGDGHDQRGPRALRLRDDPHRPRLRRDLARPVAAFAGLTCTSAGSARRAGGRTLF